MESSPTDSRWLSLVLDVAEVHKEGIFDVLWSHGAQGITEDHPGLHFADGNELYVTDEWEVPEPANPTGQVQITAWFENLQQTDELTADLVRYGREQGLEDLGLRVEAVPDKDWNSIWKERWQVTRMTRRLLIVPEWLEAPSVQPDEHVLWLDPGMAFGTGTHETTILCAELLEKEIERKPGLAILDVGTGTGILAVAGLLLGASKAVGCDTDPAAVRVSIETAKRNGVEDRYSAYEGSADANDDRWPLVLGNLLAPLIKKIAEDLAARTAQDGALLVSGLLTRQVDEVREALEGEGMKLTDRVDRNEWSGLRFIHGGAT